MKKNGTRRLPWVLMVLGALMAMWGLGMLSRTPGVMQYSVVAPQPGEGGENYKGLAASAAKAMEAMQDGATAYAVGGVKAGEDLYAGGSSERAAVYAMGEGWLEIYPRFLAEGRRISETELARGERQIMLDEGLAFKLFGSELPEDAKVTLAGREYRVAGTVRHAGSLLGGRGVGDALNYDCYIPLLAAGADGLSMDVLTLSVQSASQSGAAQLFEDTARGQWMDGGTLVNLKKEAMRRTILPRMLLLVVGLYAMVGLFKRMTGLCGRWFADFREALSQRYLKALIPRLMGIIALSVLGYAALIGLTYLLMAFSVQPLYVFTEWVPENIVEWTSIKNVFWSLVGASATLVRVGSRELRVVEFWGGLLRWGVILALLGAALLPKRKKEA